VDHNSHAVDHDSHAMDHDLHAVDHNSHTIDHSLINETTPEQQPSYQTSARSLKSTDFRTRRSQNTKNTNYKTKLPHHDHATTPSMNMPIWSSVVSPFKSLLNKDRNSEATAAPMEKNLPDKDKASPSRPQSAHGKL